MKTKKYILSVSLSFLTVGTLLLGGCSSDNLEDTTGGTTLPGPEVGSITFSLGLDCHEPVETRLTNDGDDAESHICKGEKIDKLIYAVYMADETTGNYIADVPSHPEQIMMPVDFRDGKRVEFTIDNLKADQSYRIAFWAQSSLTDAYDTSDLSCVEVKYKDTQDKNYVNNDEYRDAFCEVWSGSFVSDPTHPDFQKEINVTLKRPLAQINVGTTGADYKNILTGKEVFPNLKITHSTINIKGVARFLNVVENKVLLPEDMQSIGRDAEEALTEADFDWSVLPAFMNLENIPTTEKDLLESENEEFLRIDLDQDGKISDYLTFYPTLSSDGKTALTETFKYLSMCYVLAPAGANGTTTYGAIKVGFAEDGNGKNGNKPIYLTSANGGRNYRTNILGGLAWVKDPSQSEPGNPDDPDNPDNPDNPNDPGNPDDPDNPDDPSNPDDPNNPELPDTPAPSVFTRWFSILIQTDFQGSHTLDKDNEMTFTWFQNSQQ